MEDWDNADVTTNVRTHGMIFSAIFAANFPTLVPPYF